MMFRNGGIVSEYYHPYLLVILFVLDIVTDFPSATALPLSLLYLLLASLPPSLPSPFTLPSYLSPRCIKCLLTLSL